MDAIGNIASIENHLKYPPVISALAFTCFINASANANTQLIDFDNLTQAPCTADSCDPTVVDNQYSALGVSFGGAGLFTDSASQIVSAPNALSDFYGPSMTIHFTGSLPTAISVYVSAFNQDAIFLTAYGESGQIGSATTDGWRGTPETSTPYRDRQLVTFSGIGAISQINLDSFFDRRGTLIIDNLQFGDQLNVPLPAALGLFASALSGLWLRSCAKHRYTQ